MPLSIDVSPVDLLMVAMVWVLSVLVVSWSVKNETAAVQRLIWYGLLAHQIAAVMMFIVTFGFTGGDMRVYARVGAQIARLMRDDFFGVVPTVIAGFLRFEVPIPVGNVAFGSATGSMRALSGIFMFLVFDSLPAVCCLISLLTLLAKLSIFRALRQELAPQDSKVVAVGCLLLPSVVFWSSGLLKEPMAIIGLGIIAHGVRLLRTKRRLRGLIEIVLGGGLVFLLKGYVLPPLALSVGAWVGVSAQARKGRGMSGAAPLYWLLAGILGAVVIIATGSLMPQFAVDNLEDEFVEAQAIGARTEGGSNYQLGGSSIFAQAPVAMATVLFRPFLFEVSNALMLLSAIEMTWLTALAVLALVRSGLLASLQRITSDRTLMFCFAFTLSLGMGVGLATTNLGTLSRYRMPMMPFYYAVIAVLARTKQTRRTADALGAGALER